MKGKIMSFSTKGHLISTTENMTQFDEENALMQSLPPDTNINAVSW
jgi:hypothetical protein